MFYLLSTDSHGLKPLSLHDALPIWRRRPRDQADTVFPESTLGSAATAVRHSNRRRGSTVQDSPLHRQARWRALQRSAGQDRKSTRLNSSHITKSYAVFCLKKKKTPA